MMLILPSITFFFCRVKGSGEYVRKDSVDFNTADKKPVEAVTGRPLVEEWEKMSKSKFNGVDPSQVLQQVRIYYFKYTI